MQATEPAKSIANRIDTKELTDHTDTNDNRAAIAG